MKTSERVVLIKGDATKWYSQIVFIMNPGNPDIPVDLVAEAEMIILDHKRRNDYPNAVAQDGLAEKYSRSFRRYMDSKFDIHQDRDSEFTASNHNFIDIIPKPTKRQKLKNLMHKYMRFHFLQYFFMAVACILLAIILRSVLLF